jgi:hypothetical protein
MLLLWTYQDWIFVKVPDRAQQLPGGMGRTLLSGGLRELPGVTLNQIKPRNVADYQRSDVIWVWMGPGAG